MNKPKAQKSDLLPMKQIWSILCSSSSVDKQTNSLSIYSVLEELTLLKSEVMQKQKEIKEGSLPVVFPFQLITLWERAESGILNETAKIQLIDPHGKTLLDTDYAVKIEQQQERNRFIASFNAFPFTNEGVYQFKILLKNHDKFLQLGSADFRVKLADKI
jgi:hypothetical protein